MGLPWGGSGRWLGLARPSLYYLMAPPAKRPEAAGASLEPMSAAGEKALTLGFLEARAPGSRQTTREHLSRSDVSSQVTLIRDYSRMWVPGHGASKFCWGLWSRK